MSSGLTLVRNINMLGVNDIDVYYGDIQALKKVSLRAEENQIISMVGSNGAGKTTTLMTISGFNRTTSGTISFDELRIDRLGPHEIVELGLIHVPEGRMVFYDMTVMENLEMGCYSSRARKNSQNSLKEVMDLFPILRDRENQLAGTLSGGEQQMLAIGRGLMAQPRLLMLDEPSLGLAPLVVEMIFEVIKTIREKGTSILLVEQDVFHALSISNTAYVIENGEIVMEGRGEEILKDERIKEAYLGL